MIDVRAAAQAAAVDVAAVLATPCRSDGSGLRGRYGPRAWGRHALGQVVADRRTVRCRLTGDAALHGDGDEAELVGFSYWLRSEGGPPAWFAGPNDTWHQHTGLCVVNGWVDREMSGGPDACAGTILGGADLWMLHAWVVEGWENRWGDFAVMNPSLCPPVEGTPELARCPEAFTL